MLLNSDYVQTPEWCANDMVDFFKPEGIILDPCRGKNKVFHTILNCEWAEIIEGRNFFEITKKYDWIIGNPPYSIFNKWIKHSYSISKNIVYLLPTFKVYNALSLMRLYYKRGHVKHIRMYDTGNNIEWARSRPICAVHFQVGYYGDTGYSEYNEKTHNQSFQRTSR